MGDYNDWWNYINYGYQHYKRYQPYYDNAYSYARNQYNKRSRSSNSGSYSNYSSARPGAEADSFSKNRFGDEPPSKRQRTSNYSSGSSVDNATAQTLHATVSMLKSMKGGHVSPVNIIRKRKRTYGARKKTPFRYCPRS